MARPPKEPSEHLDILLHFRCTRGDRAHIQSRAEATGLGLSEYLRRISRDGEIVLPAPDPAAAALYEFKRLANLANQQMPIAHIRQSLPAELLALDARLTMAID